MRTVLLTAILISSFSIAQAKEPIRLANRPNLSPDGQKLAFDYEGDIWLVPTAGGTATALTTNPARDSSPKFSPDGKEIAFLRDHEGSPQIFVVPATGGTPKQMTFHTAGYTLYEWTPDGKGWLVGTTRDHGWARRNNDRLQIVHRWTDAAKRKADTLLFDDYAANGTLSADGKSVLFTREGPEWWRKGYYGSQSSQIWSYDLEKKTFGRLATGEWDSRWPLFGTNGAIFFAQSGPNGFNIVEQTANGKARKVTDFKDDSTVLPTISRDGSTLVFRHLFDFYSIKPGANEVPKKLEIFRDDDHDSSRLERKVLTSATAAAFTADGLEIAFIAGGDVWVMDTELKDPKRVTNTPEEERSVIWAPDGKALYFVSDAGGSPEIWKATKPEAGKPWFLTPKFNKEKLTADGEEKSRLSFSPDGSKFAWVAGRGNLIVSDLDAKNPKKVIESWNAPQYDWSPDGKWIVYAQFDNDFNQDIWIKPVDGSKPPFNLSRHPYNDSNPVWSPDGKMIAFVGDRDEKNTSDIHYVWLKTADEEKNNRDRTLEKALEKFQKSKNPFKKDPMGGPKDDADADPDQDEPKKDPMPMPPVGKKEAAPVAVTIDFDGIHDRIRRIAIANSNESNLFWSPDSKKLAFNASVDGTAGVYSVEFPDSLRPSQVTSSSGSGARWLKSGSIVWLSAGRPASFSPGAGAAAPAAAAAPAPGGGRGPGGRLGGGGAAPAAAAGGYAFTAYQDIDIAKKHQAAFDMAWRTMRDNWYDDRLGNRDWKAIREKYRGMAETTEPETLTTVVQMMLGELNGSHLGFTAGAGALTGRRGGPAPAEPTIERSWILNTQHLGVRFDPAFAGPGFKVKDVVPDSPAAQKRSQLNPGDVITNIDGVEVDATLDTSLYFNVGPGHEFRLKVKDAAGKERDVVIRPTSFLAVRSALYKKWITDNRAAVEKMSNGKLGYLHISAMDNASFRKFEEALYDAGAGKDGLIIDVRENGGGSTADLLMTALTQPQHAIAVPRDGGQGYPQDRTVFATWTKPITVLCNQNSFSNAEIFSHAVKTIKRGQVVGVPTAGGVISTGGTTIMDVGFLRMPFRGWYLVDTGEDMELNGAVPHHIVWPQPGDAAKGIDAQIEKAVKVLEDDVKAWKARPQPKLKKATERK